MAYTHSNANRRVRVTRRIEGKPDHRGRAQLIARKGEGLTLREAYRRGLSVKDLEPIGPGGEVSFAAFEKASKAKDADKAEQAIADAEQEAAAAERRAQQASEQVRADRARGHETEFPVDRGGGNWLLSDGTKFRGKRKDAEKAEASLAGGEKSGGDTDGDAAGEDTSS